MKIIKPEVKEIIQLSGLKGMYETIEVAGRNCYKSEDKICDGSAEKLIENFKKRSHYSPLEFGTVYLTIPSYNERDDEGKKLELKIFTLKHNKFSKCVSDKNADYITTNYRVILENDLEDVMNKYITEPTILHARRRFFRIICDRALLAEFTRHRVFSFCVESQRYCNYNKDQFGNEITVIGPCWLYEKEDTEEFELWKTACENSETAYFKLLSLGWRPEQARTVLPNSTKTDICMCGFESDWNHFFELRESQSAHPQAREVAKMIKNIF